MRTSEQPFFVNDKDADTAQSRDLKAVKPISKASGSPLIACLLRSLVLSVRAATATQMHHFWTVDHGGEWWEDPPPGAPASARPFLALRLRPPDLPVSLFPATSHLEPYLEYLAGDGGVAEGVGATGGAWRAAETAAAAAESAGGPRQVDTMARPPILSIMAPQFEWRSGAAAAPAAAMRASVIVIATGLANPQGERRRLRCRIGSR